MSEIYPDYMLESIEKVHETRERRKEQEMPTMSVEERDDLIKKIHPDYLPGTKRELKVGPSKGQEVPHEFADLFEAYSLVDPDKFDVSHIDYDVDVLVIGGGGAGCSAALLAQENGADVLLATKLRLGDANTTMAQGGIQAADRGEMDDPIAHYLDVMGGGHFVNKPDLVRTLVMDAPSVIKWLEDLGVMFDKDEAGNMIERPGGGTCRKRMHSARDYTGGEIMKTLRDEVKCRDIEVSEFSPAIELLKEGHRCTGAILYNIETQEYYTVRAKCVVMATGGAGRLHCQRYPTTNHYGATADGLILGYRAGCEVFHMDTIQFHPTGAVWPDQILGFLVTEKCRTMGAQVTNKDGERFVYELEPRDAEATAYIRECQRGKGVKTPSGNVGVWLDLPLIEEIEGEGAIKKNLPAMYRQYNRFGIDITRDPVLVYPTQHYQNGGVEILNDKCETHVPNLYFAGECSGGVHGRNRLMGNSLLDVMLYGRRAGKYATLKAKETNPGKLGLEHVKKHNEEVERISIPRERCSPMLLPDYRRDESKEKIIEGIF